MAPLESALLRLVLRVFHTGFITPEQRLAFATATRPNGVPAAQREAVFDELLRQTWGDVIDEELLTAEDWARLAMIVRELRLPSLRVPFPDEAARLAS